MTEEYKQAVYECLFWHNKTWPHEGPTIFFWGTRIHYKDFMKAKRGSL